jgi:hypothetical protein
MPSQTCENAYSYGPNFFLLKNLEINLMSDKLLKLFKDDFINSKLICYFSNFLLNFMIRDRVNFFIYIL